MKREIEWIQALRGIAALLVVICHARVVLRGTPWEAFAERSMTPGALGVDLFFIRFARETSAFRPGMDSADAEGVPSPA